VAALRAEEDRLRISFRDPFQHKRSPPWPQKPPPEQQIPFPRRHSSHMLLVPSPLRSQNTEVYIALHVLPTGKLTQQTSPAVHVCTITTGRLFVTDISSKRRFLVDTDPHLCVYPRRLIPRGKEWVNYDL
jgi:hypothetical protein